jgi:glutaconyl-CoA/methylmalonyl-CoA decarboxylase subunit delta
MQELTLMQQFADPALIDKLSGGEKAAGALVTTLMGMGITFIVLSLLWGIIALLTKILDRNQKKHHESELVMETAMEAAVHPHEHPAAPVNEADDAELVAVITAAIAASMGVPPSGLVINKIRRAKGNTTTWSQAGASEIIASRRI